MVKRRPKSTGGKQVTGRALTQFKPGQCGNPKGRQRGSRNKLSEDFFRDLCDAWQAFGKAALMTAAWTHPVEFVRVVASLVPRELEATTTVNVDRMTNDVAAVARTLGQQIKILNASNDQELESAFAAMKQQGVGAIRSRRFTNGDSSPNWAD